MDSGALADFVVDQPLVVDSGDSGLAWRTTVTGSDAGSTATISTDDGRSIASARLAAARGLGTVDAPTGLGGWDEDVEALYQRFAQIGAQFGPSFQTLTRWRVGDNAGEGWLTLAASNVGVIDGLHPTLIDGAFQLCVLAATADGDPASATALLPLAVDSFESYLDVGESPSIVRAVVGVDRHVPGGSVTASVRMFDANGAPLAALDGVRFVPADSTALAALGHTTADLYDIRWHSLPALEPPADDGGAWVVLADDEWGTAIGRQLAARGCPSLVVRPGSTTGPDGPGRWALRPHDGDGIAACLADDTWRRGKRLCGIVHALALDVVGTPSDLDDDWMITGSAFELTRALARSAPDGARLWLVTRNAQSVSGGAANPRQAGLSGFAAVVASEHPELACAAVDLGGLARQDDVDQLVEELLGRPDGGDAQPAVVARRGAARFAPRLHRYLPRPAPAAAPPRARLTAGVSGTLDELAWTTTEAPAAPLAPGLVLLRVLASGINFRDVLIALGMYPGSDSTLGGECVGVVEAVADGVTELSIGDIVFGFVPGSLATEVVVPAHFLRPVPEGITVEQAAALPVAFLTAMYGLQRIAGIDKRHTRPRSRRRRRCWAGRRAGRPASRSEGVRHCRLGRQARVAGRTRSRARLRFAFRRPSPTTCLR